MGSRAGWFVLAVLAAPGCGGNDFADQSPVDGPLQIQATAQGMRVVRLAWSSVAVDGAVTWEVERRANLAGSFEHLIDVPPQAGDSVVYLDLSVEPETIYGYRVRGIGASGSRSQPSVVAGVTTPSRPGVQVQVTTLAPPGATPALDPDGYQARLSGADTASGIISSLAGAHEHTFKPLPPGTYVIHLTGLASQCRTSQASDTVVVVDTGTATLARSEFTVDCRDPSRGELTVQVAVENGPAAEPFALRITGEADDASLPDDERLVFLDRTLGPAGGAITLPSLRPGNYNVELRDFDAECALDGAAAIDARVDALAADTAAFAVRCGTSGSSGDFRPGDPTKAHRIRYRWEPAQASVGQQVTLIASADFGPGGFPLSSLQLLTSFDPALVRADQATFEPGFVSAAQIVGGNIAWLIAANTPSSALTYPIARFTFTVVGAGQAQVVTRSELQAFDDPGGNSFLDQAEVLLDAPLSINGGGGGGGGGGGNTSPTAAIDGPAQLSGVAGIPVSLSAMGSTDVDGVIVTYAWALQGATPPAAGGVTASAVWAAPGTYTIQLTVTDDDGGTGVATKQVVITPSGGGGGGNDVAELRLTFGPADGGGVRPLTLSLQFLQDIAETPGPEALKTFVIDRVTWDDAVLEFISVEFPGNVSGSSVTNPALPGHVAISGNIVGAAQGGTVSLATIRLRPRAGNGVTTTATAVSVLRSSTQLGEFNYASRTRVVEASYP